MKKRSRNITQNKLPVKKVLLAVAIWAAIVVLGALITSYLIHSEAISLDSMRFGTVITLIASSLIATAYALTLCKEKQLLTAAACFAGIVALLLLGNLLFIDNGIYGFIQTVAVVLSGCAAAFLIEIRPKKGRGHRKFKF